MPDPIASLIEKDRILDFVKRLFIGTDKRDWPAVMKCFADMVLFDIDGRFGTRLHDSPSDRGLMGAGAEGFEGDPSPGRELPGDC
jgi:hypothetical protein